MKAAIVIAVENKTDVSGGGVGRRTRATDQIQNLYDQFTELTVLNKLTQMQQRSLFGFRDGVHEFHDTIHDGLFEFIASLFT